MICGLGERCGELVIRDRSGVSCTESAEASGMAQRALYQMLVKLMPTYKCKRS